ncbi:phosphate-starvation-inducible protein PsiE [Paenibacillus sp. CMAA1739]|uniref:phosphate-starvation-inducible protein PsiE n=1 Tax=Paenibacillus ottowii TaxID=2315729 RepID=UPI0011B18C69|nr:MULTISPECIES: phosphate-starvation-inducible protein PsiE [Paenibacillus]MDP1512308.1 phosphate-starvation-inducible protein PsiE [Paenibacillus ottowii]MEC4568278.1 phosphate-starvation-inducible protein PsiE [Paenibacillus sp. CMAA1739]QDY85447.1 phosphate-starvation-inducible protein PsiE [Paenibacillus polymyxa]
MNALMKYIKKLPGFLQMILNISLFLVGLVLSFLLLKETWSIFSYVFLYTEADKNYYEFTEELLVFFLYFEFIALIVKYFKTNFHFPLRYFIYIGITAVIRLIIVDHDDAQNTFWWSIAILVMVGSLLIANSKLLKRES